MRLDSKWRGSWTMSITTIIGASAKAKLPWYLDLVWHRQTVWLSCSDKRQVPGTNIMPCYFLKPKECFSHSQLHVTMSRVGDQWKLFVHSKDREVLKCCSPGCSEMITSFLCWSLQTQELISMNICEKKNSTLKEKNEYNIEILL